MLKTMTGSDELECAIFLKNMPNLDRTHLVNVAYLFAVMTL